MILEDKEHMTFIIEKGLHYYMVMPFGLKSPWAIYKEVVSRIFQYQVGKNIEVYVDDVLVKRCTIDIHFKKDNLGETFAIIKKFKYS